MSKRRTWRVLAAGAALTVFCASRPPPARADSVGVAFVAEEAADVAAPPPAARRLVPATGVEADVDLFRIGSDGTLQKIATMPAGAQTVRFGALAPGDYLVQTAPVGYLAVKKRVALKGDLDLSLELRRPMDYGNGELLPEASGPGRVDTPFAGARYAFGCNVVSLIFVQWQGQNTWTDALRAPVVTAATNAMAAFENIAPPEAHFTSHVENLGTYTVTSAVGDTCGQGQNWVSEILTVRGYTTGSFTDRANQLARDRAAAVCGSSPLCSSCGPQNSGFLFFIARENSGSGVGGWNCGGTFQISYYGNSTGQAVYMHEIGHAFGTNDEYCTNLGGSNGMYCCGWPSGSWGCSNTGGCLSTANSNCDPLCGSNCSVTGGFTDCKDGCPQANCTSHTPCAMDGSGTLTFCETSRRQMGWVDSDCDGVLDCLESDCGTDRYRIGSRPSCIPSKYSGVFVDPANANPLLPLGTEAFPVGTVLQGYNVAPNGSDVNIRPGTYPENVTMGAGKAVNLKKWGCDTEGPIRIGQ